ncbi:glycosyl hydrolase family 5 [Flaviaesturariibacter aridisoli]|uniref:Glycosyl hydrolase family 5 n=1 Tax=Flaviaesturariibacter aridisoli TaxID=2545761 RepID=A0A4R4E2K6_9BACT|nr:glycosyl hydrolase family 5 [Flaviaesturariibacter aridisoli]
MRSLIACTIALLGAVNGSAQGFLHAQGDRLADGSGRPVLLRGMGLGGWMLQEPYMLQLSGGPVNQQEIRQQLETLVGIERTKAFYDAWLDGFVTRADIDSLAAWGFNSVRLPMHYNLFTLPVDREPVKGRNTWLSKGFTLTDSLLRWCAAKRMYLILDLHAAPGGQGNDLPISDRDSSRAPLWQDSAAQNKTVALWTRLAERYAREPWIGAYDLINEPNWNFSNPQDRNGCNDSSNAPLRAFYMRLTTAVRRVDKNHLVIIEGNCWGNNYRGVLPPWDSNMALSFHKYWNDNNEGAIAGIADLRKRYGIPVWMGESGENSNAWFRDAVELLERHDIGWAWWPHKKMGMNNPFEIPNNDDFRAVQSWLKGRGRKPAPDAAFRGLMQLARDSRTDRAHYHPDVVDALFRQVGSHDTRPFQPHSIGPDTTVWAVHFDLGRNGEAYFARDSGNYWVSSGKRTEWNRGWTFRNDPVDILPCADSGIGFQVASLGDREWLQYSVDVTAPGTYRLGLRLRAEGDAQPLLWVNGAAVKLDATGGESWKYTRSEPVYLPAGRSRIRIGSAGEGLAVNYLRFEALPDEKGSQ